MDYIIISLEQGTGKNPVFWRADNCGYTNSPFAAGIYSEEKVKADPNYYNNGYSAVAVPLTDAAMGQINFQCSFDEKGIEKFFQKEVKKKPAKNLYPEEQSREDYEEDRGKEDNGEFF